MALCAACPIERQKRPPISCSRPVSIATATNIPDCLSFVWWENGDYLLIDPGRYGYQPGTWRDCLSSTRSHNAVEIDGQDYERNRGHAYGSAITAMDAGGGNSWRLAARRAHEGLDVDHERQLTYVPGRGLVVVDRLTNLGHLMRNYTLWWHPNAAHRLAGAVRENGFTLDIGGDRHVVATCAVDTPDVACAPLTVCGAMEPQRHGWWSPGYLRVEPATVVGFPFQADGNIVVVTVFEILTGNQAAQATLNRHDQGFVVDGLGEAPLIIRV